MCGIAGFCNPYQDLETEAFKWSSTLERMNHVQKHRGPNEDGTLLTKHCGLAQVRLSIIDLKTGHQPMTRTWQGKTCSIAYNGEIYNMHTLKKELELHGFSFQTTSDTEVILAGYLLYGTSFFPKLNGIFSFAIWDCWNETLILCRDALGVKPLFFTLRENFLIFSSEIKGIFEFPGISPELDTQSLCEIFALGPAKTSGSGVFRNILELKPGHYIRWGYDGWRQEAWWKLESHLHTDSTEETVEKTRELLLSAIKGQMLSDIPISTFLSGGVDSSLVTAICSKELEKNGKQLTTFSFDFEGNNQYFQSNDFQPTQDRHWVDIMVNQFHTNHHYLECNNQSMADFLYRAVDARDLPCMADVESSMLYFCSLVKDYNQVTLTGECADEIFGGYPWFHKKEALEQDCFPWSPSMEPRKALLKDEILYLLPLEEYAKDAYLNTIHETPKLEGESKIEARRREIGYLNLRWFMQTLLDRMDRTSMHCGLEARVPFADPRIVQYLWNVPWELKCLDHQAKGLLRRASKGILPDEVLYRRKNPYPKTYNPGYETLINQRLSDILDDTSSPIHQLIDAKKVRQFLKTKSDYGKPWYGQLMAGPQMTAYLLQINYWLKTYHIRLKL
ncbi:MAG TPA: asparagine synthase (glutamine-hydrolyzing) [Candidatus Fimimorpha faecalis]|uniref:asparagine synthase (glutamine-hydrolyzing) n=1 Tax=Candidatus Fimimorpha faecalis TaxID=2840824 RepID=A0A9D1JE28_9FIRM|nr:asparagine synthase (glutamine-hydrolyzing) [Candidatus Fimimorpha faecalis]